MKRRRFLGLLSGGVAVLTLAPCAGASGSPHIAAFGDSITAGSLLEPWERWVNRMKDYFKRPASWLDYAWVSNWAVGGATSAGVLTQVQNYLDEDWPLEYAHLLCGTNDMELLSDGITPRQTSGQYAANLGAAVDLILAAGARPMVLPPPPVDLAARPGFCAPNAWVAYRDAAYGVAAEHGASGGASGVSHSGAVSYLSLTDWFQRAYGSKWPAHLLDGVHPDAYTHWRWGNEVVGKHTRIDLPPTPIYY